MLPRGLFRIYGLVLGNLLLLMGGQLAYLYFVPLEQDDVCVQRSRVAVCIDPLRSKAPPRIQQSVHHGEACEASADHRYGRCVLGRGR